MKTQVAKRSNSSTPPQLGDDILVVTFDSLRFDVAENAMTAGETPYLASLLSGGWECRHAPGNFTFASHMALFAGFWPTPTTPRVHHRPFALKFSGSRSIGPATLLFEADNIIHGLANEGYHTVCVGGVAFFNKKNALGRVMPSYFQESHWRKEFSVSHRDSTSAQVACGIDSIRSTAPEQPLLLFMNISALHAPTHYYELESKRDSCETQQAALAYVDGQLEPLVAAFQERGHSGVAYLMSDHGTLFGEGGFTGHRVGHQHVWNVPYGEFNWENSQ